MYIFMFAFTGWKCCLKHMRVEMPYHEIQKSGTCTADYNTVLGWWWSIHSWRLGHEISSQEVQRRLDWLVCQTRHQLAHQCGLLEGKTWHRNIYMCSYSWRSFFPRFFSHCIYPSWYCCKCPWNFKSKLLDRQRRMLQELPHFFNTLSRAWKSSSLVQLLWSSGR